MTDKTIAHCQWCGREMEVSARGRRRKFCSQACRQRSYEKRAGVAKGASIPIAARRDSSPGKAASAGKGSVEQRIGDGLFEVRCLAEDLNQALADDMGADVLGQIAAELIVKTREVERLLP